MKHLHEKIREAKDPNLYSVRIDQTYRGIVLKPEHGHVYLLLWVDHHDDAYAWAAHRRFTINAHTGSLQVLPTATVEPVQTPLPLPPTSTGLFKHIEDTHLLQLGVPEEILPLVRQLQSDADLEAHEAQLPQEAVEALYMARNEHSCHSRQSSVFPLSGCAINPGLRHPFSRPMICHFKAIESCATSRATINVSSDFMCDEF